MSDDGQVHELRQVPLKKRLVWGVAVGALMAFVAWGLSYFDFLAEIESSTLDVRQRLLARRTPATDRVAIIVIDEYSIRNVLKEDKVAFPWPRNLYVAFIDFLQAAGARTVVFDILFNDPDPKRKTDGEFGEGAKAAGNVVMAAKLELRAPDAPADGFEFDPAALEKARLNVSGWPHARWGEMGVLLAPVQEILVGVKALGFVNAQKDGAGNTRRRAELIQPYPDEKTHVASLALAAARAGLGIMDPASVEGGRLHLGPLDLPLGAQGRPLLRFYGPPGTIQTENASSIFASLNRMGEEKPPIVPLETFKDRVVFIGLNAAGREDISPSPVSDIMPGVEMQATACANILGDEFLRELDGPVRLGFWVLVGVLSGLLCFGIWRAVPAGGAVVALLVALTGGSCLAYRSGWVLDLFFPCAVVGTTYFAAVLSAYLTEGKAKREVSRAFGQYLSPVVIRELMASPHALKLGGETRDIAVYFSDIAGFSTFSEGMSAHELVSFLNEYLSVMTDIILESRGVVDKYVGDLIMAFWGAPLVVERPGRVACLAVLEQRKAMVKLQQKFLAEGRPPFDFRTGLNLGPATIGNMGSTRRFNYTAMGDTVNLASRLEGANKHFGTSVLMTESVRESAGDAVVARKIGKVQVVGKSVPTMVYELISSPDEIAPEAKKRLDRYHVALEHLEGGKSAEALGELELLNKESPDSVLELCLEKAREMVASGDRWDGVWVLKSKG